MQPLDLMLTLSSTITISAFERPCRLIQQLLLPGVNLIGMHLIALGQIGPTVACSLSASSAIFAFSAASIFRLVRLLISRSA